MESFKLFIYQYFTLTKANSFLRLIFLSFRIHKQRKVVCDVKRVLLFFLFLNFHLLNLKDYLIVALLINYLITKL